jgi:hypothetical protein
MPITPIRCVIAVAFALMASRAEANGTGMYLCRSPVIASMLWGDMLQIGETGVPVTAEMTRSLAAKYECRFVTSQSLKPIDFVAGHLLITDGSVKGWAEPHLYIHYVNVHTN